MSTAPARQDSAPFAGVQGYLAAVWRCRYFWLSLARNDLRTRYRRSWLGVGWSLLQPVSMTLVLCTVFHTVFKMSMQEYGAFLLSGLTFWNYATFVVTHGSQCFYQGETYIRQYPAPLAIYPLRVVLGAGFHFGIALILVVLLSWWSYGFGNLAVLPALLPAAAALLVLGWAVAAICGLTNVFFPDARHLFEIGLQILFYATPIMYRPDMLRERGLGWLVDYNPLVAVLELVRRPTIDGQLPGTTTIAIAMTTTALACLAASWALSRWQRTLIFHL